MKWDEIDPLIKEWCFAREMLRRLGFTAEEIFFACQPLGNLLVDGVEISLGAPAIFCRLDTQGTTFTWTIGALTRTKEEIESQYLAACELWNAGDADPIMAEFFESKAFASRFGLMSALAQKGIRMPNAQRAAGQ
jgi:hypothetical protein